MTLKTAGLLALMAKAGLYLPVGLPPQHSQGGTHPPGALPLPPSCQLLWFDLILADIGDAQSLQQNLSTFSGHIRRIKAVLAAATKHSLVLLDEVRGQAHTHACV